jgi:dCMP deaminase
MAIDKRFSDLAEYVAQQWSTDRSTKVGCVVVGPDGEVRSIGVNGFPRDCHDREERHQRPAKYMWTEHSERNAFNNATLSGTSLKGCTLYSNWFPCADCARGIIQVGITRVVGYTPDFNHPKYGAEFKAAVQMLFEAGVGINYIGTRDQTQKKDIPDYTGEHSGSIQKTIS